MLKFNDFLKVFNYDCEVCIYDEDTFVTLYKGDACDISLSQFEGYNLEGIYNGSNGFDGIDIAVKMRRYWKC